MLTKLVNGTRVVLTLEEEAKVRAEWKFNEENPSPPPGPTVEERLATLEADIKTLLEA